MAFICPNCGREYESGLFEFNHTLTCDCGETIEAGHTFFQEENERTEELKRMADRICSLILSSDYPEIDIEIERQKLRQRCNELFPERMHLYEIIYEARFKRLIEQFRKRSED